MSGTKVVHTHKAYSRPEELTNFITYVVAAVLSFVGLVFSMLKSAGSGARVVFPVAIFGALSVVVFAVGALCHFWLLGEHARVARRVDRTAVAVLMLAVFTPILLVGFYFGGRADRIWSYVLFAVMVCAVTAAALVNAFDVAEHKTISLVLYVILCFCCIVRCNRIIELCGYECFWMLFGGACSYFAGAVVCSYERLPARHVLWHLFVMCGAALHFFCIYTYLL